MDAPRCHYCTGTPMIEKVRVPKVNDTETVIYQCDQCKRIDSQVEPRA